MVGKCSRSPQTMRRGATRVVSIAGYYDATVLEEWHRLDSSWLEFAITQHFIRDKLPPGSQILDLGGGPGRYALALAKDGYSVDLIDLAPGNIAFAKQKAEECGVRLGFAMVGDARAIPSIDSESYDGVLCLGPLYHLIERNDRVRCIEEVRRVLKPGGLAFFAFISTYAPVHYAAKHEELLAALMPQLRGSAGRDSYIVDPDKGLFTEAFFIHPSLIAEEFEGCGIERVSLFGAESLFAQSELRLLSQSPETRSELLALSIAHAEDIAALYNSEHIVFVGQKPGGKS